ncbi:hypothetical protein WN55_05355 [Dufourea novaeangliae]|uniref:Transposable element Tc3 transposase n=1 Tax=Dufourea novaeangliae TaxID=178035 RepID=A0A154PN44_DUFNO|nr:hypothetical protein WN55_05355 [Dufourea novaeangliae]
MWFMHDGAPPHYTIAVREHLNEYFGDRWIGRGGPVPWPARSPDLNPLHFFFWGHLKILVYSTPVNSLEELEQRIRFSVGIITNTMPKFRKIHTNLHRRVTLCTEENGGHFEQLLS